MKKSLIVLVAVMFMFSAVPAFSQFIVGADYFNFEFEDESAPMFGGYLGYDMGDWELSLSYYMWEKDYEFTYGSTSISWTMKLKPLHLIAIYKYALPTSPEWVPFIGAGYGQTEFSIDGYEDDAESYDSWLWMIGVRYYFNQQTAVNLKYVSAEVDIEGNSGTGSGFGIGVSYKFK